MEDTNGVKVGTVLSGLLTSNQYFVISKDLFSAVDLTKIKRIIFSTDPTLTTLTSGTLTIGTKTLFYATALATTLPSKPAPIVTAGSSATTFLTAPSSTQMKLNFDVTPSSASFSGMSFSFDNVSTAPVETQDLSQGSALTFGFQAGSSLVTKIRLEVEDVTCAKASKLLTINTGTTYITVQKSLLSGIDWTKIKNINFVIDRTMITSSSAYKSYVHINANNFLYTPTVIPSTTLTSANISTLPSSPSLFLMPGSSATTSLAEITAKFNLGYDVTTTGA